MSLVRLLDPIALGRSLSMVLGKPIRDPTRATAYVDPLGASPAFSTVGRVITIFTWATRAIRLRQVKKMTDGMLAFPMTVSSLARPSVKPHPGQGA
ncbi:hypothetical protein CABS01_09015 [Colletotrichum abscissum]|uniref:Uncharacterized protein n=1 Tax=Colletotrichum abscissum TaxID=1671311 RepID=A0A9Q0B061_9PEZI|nr:uncharacterized protein CABS01_09015 [Colletotrichum abscissum]KAI3539101.1 hypothetical protein CABS02_11522 [Colletotrichum abscissum]KAK1503626.1 hypothetical protein CABS01_09015 [Colletotrichum abscissum]